MISQCTVAESVALAGIGLHTGSQSRIQLRPAAAKTGIVFHHYQQGRVVTIPAQAEYVVDTRMATVLGLGSARISTVEHLMSALYAFGIDNLHIDVYGPEIPALDGSAAGFMQILEQAGRQPLESGRQFLAVRKPVFVGNESRHIQIIPSRFFRVTCTIEFQEPWIGRQQRGVKVSPDAFSSDIAQARTFGFFKEVEALKGMGLALGGSLENAIVIDEQGVVNPEGLRYEDEFVRHKILDTIGDMALLGHPVLGHVKAYKAGHELHHALVEKLLQEEDAWQFVKVAPNHFHTDPDRVRPRSLDTQPAVSKI